MTAVLLFQELIAPLLERPGVGMGPLRDTEAIWVNGTAFAYLGPHQELVVKLPREQVVSLLQSGGAQPVIRSRRTLRDWAGFSYHPGCEPQWRAVLEQSHDFVAPLT